MNMSEDKRELDKGRYPKVAINNENRVVEVHKGRVHRYIYYRIGTIDAHNKTIAWLPHVYELCWGRFPSVAVHGDRVVVTYDRSHGFFFTSYYFVGNFDAAHDGAIVWERDGGAENHKLFDSYGVAETSVAINERNIVVVGRGWYRIVCRVGRFRGNNIEFQQEFRFDHLGYCPSVCLDGDGYVVMVWQSFTLRKLNYVTTNIPDPERPSITWPQHVSVRSYGYGYNPTIAMSPVGGHIIEEHETNYAPYRCHLYYHTGVLEKPRRQGQAPQQEQVLVQEHAFVQPQDDEDGQNLMVQEAGGQIIPMNLTRN